MNWTWESAEPPLRAAGVLARGDAAVRLGQRLLERKGHWEVAAAEGLLVAFGDNLPWLPNLTWLGMHPEAPGLWLPTATHPSLHPALVAEAVAHAHGLPAVLVPEGVVALDHLGPLHRPALEAWLP